MNEKLPAEALTSDEKHFTKMHFRLRGPIERYVIYLTGSRQYSEDVTQDIFEKLWKNWGKLRDLKYDALEDYVYVVIRNHFLNLKKEQSAKFRKQFRRQLLATTSKWCLHDDILVAEGFHLYKQAIDRLPKKERLVYLYYENDHQPKDIAKKLNRSTQTIHNQLSNARKSVRCYLNKCFELNIGEEAKKNCLKPASLN